MDKDYQSDIGKKYKKYADFKKQMDEIQSFYNTNLNLALYQNLDKLDKSKIFETLQTNTKQKILILFYGFKQTTENKDLEKLYRLFIRSYDEVLRSKIKKYSIVFFNSMCNSNDNFANFKSMYKTLPLMYYSKLQKIYIIHPSFSVKSLDWIVFGRLNKLFSKRLQYINNLEELNKLKLPNSIIDKLPQEIINFNNLENNKSAEIVIPNPPSDSKQMVTKSMIITKKKSPFDVLAIPLEKYDMSTQGIPKLLKLLVSTFNYNPKLLEIQGIFRKSGSIEDEEILVTELFKKNEKYLQSVQDGIIIAGLIKKIFTNLVEPLFSYQIYDKIMKINGISVQQQVDFVKTLLKQLPDLNYRVLLFFSNFIKEKVIKKEAITKMSSYNCAVVFAPCFLRPKFYQMQDLMCSGKIVKVLLIIFTKFEQVFGTTAEVMEVFRKSAQKSQQQQFEQKRMSSQSPKRGSWQQNN